jgi:hypothetical protein
MGGTAAAIPHSRSVTRRDQSKFHHMRHFVAGNVFHDKTGLSVENFNYM